VHLRARPGRARPFAAFRDGLSQAVYGTGVYASRGTADTTNASDTIYDRGSLLIARRRGAGYQATKTLTVEA